MLHCMILEALDVKREAAARCQVLWTRLNLPDALLFHSSHPGTRWIIAWSVIVGGDISRGTHPTPKAFNTEGI